MFEEKNISIGNIIGCFCNWDNPEPFLQIAASVGDVVTVVSGTEDNISEMLLHLHGHMCFVHLCLLKECVTTYRHCVGNGCVVLKHWSGKKGYVFLDVVWVLRHYL